MDKRRNGSLCIHVHKAVIILEHRENGLNYIVVMSSTTRQKTANFALGECAIKTQVFTLPSTSNLYKLNLRTVRRHQFPPMTSFVYM